MLIFIGLPLFYLELYIGQYTGVGPLQAFSSIAPFFTGLGYCTLVVISIISIYYMIIVAWTLFYTIVSLTGNLGWGSGEYDKICRENNTGLASDLTYYLKNCTSIADICTSTGFQPLNAQYCLDGDVQIPWYTNVTRTLAAEEYYNEGILFYLSPDWETLLSPSVWGDAASQMWSILFFLMLFILGLGSQFAGIEAINTAIVDRWPHLRKNYWRVTAFTCFTCFILGIPMCFSG
ncbi:Transporter, partial [Operophtera brumata]